MKEKTILKSLHLCLDIDTSIFDSIFDIQGYGHHLYTYIGKLNEKVEEADLNKFFYVNNDHEKQKLQFENRILNLVKKGNFEFVKNSLQNLGVEIMSPYTKDLLRNEKNYSIIIFEKLSQLAIESGLDEIESTRVRDQLITDNEKARDTDEIIKVRNGAILLFAKKIEKIVEENLSPFMTTILQYINNNLYQDISLASIAKEFNVSQTTLNLTFKNEIGITVKKYLTKSKMEDAKKLLFHDLSISDISQMLGFADSSHFCKKFKKETGMTPTEYKRENKNK
ncbi:YSIRK-targeted surface antigen transcriptional regulator [Staphylococcus debuckii]|uniref:YSIRK-targeted surface antigen transcriptional regulator n=1 Tax=Staphylococcus debuckii TaxID=2044912 RepID=UPI0013DF8DF9|nr:YSIRK-targeted surface antigen transcriptional regulator [Staphylococcus debuckii]